MTFHRTYIKGLDFVSESMCLSDEFMDLDFTKNNSLPDSLSKLPPDSIKTCIKGENISEKNFVSSSKKKIFLSCFGALSPKQVEFLNRLKFDLSKIDIEVINFDRTKYRLTGQLSAIQTEMASCHGVIAILFKDIYIQKGIFRPETEDMCEITNHALSSPWINIELGLAYGMKKQILLLHDGQIKDGLLDNEITDCIIKKIDYLSYNYADYDYEVQKWANNLEYFTL